MTALGRAGLAVALLPLGLLLSASCNRNSSKPDTGIIVEITDAQTPVVAMDGAVDIATDGPSDFAPDAAGGKDTFSATGGAGSTDASSGTGGAIGTDGGTLAVDVRTVMGDGLDVDTPPDVPFGGIGGTGGATAMGGMTGTGGAASTGGAGTGGAPTNGGTTTTGATITNGGATSTGGSATTGGTTASGGAGGGGGTSVGGGTPPSCIGLPATCGPSGNEDCCMSLLVPGGAFFRGYDGVVSTDKSYPATVSDFYLDKYEITVGRFRQFANAGMGTQASPPAAGAGVHPLIAASGWDSGWNANLPADTVALKTAVKCESSFQT